MSNWNLIDYNWG